MARSYRSETVDALYAAIADDEAVAADFPQRRLAKDDKTGRIKKLAFRQAADFPLLQIRTGQSDSGLLFGIQSFADEAAAAVADDFDRRAEIVLEFVYDQEDDARRDALETAALAAIARAGNRLVAGLAGAVFRRTSGPAEVSGTRRHVSRITLACNYLFDSSDLI